MSTENRNIGEIVIRADASVAMGTGHVMRCLALAQAWQDAGGRAVFAMAETTPTIRARLAAESCEVVPVATKAGMTDDSHETLALAREHHADWIVVDGYQFSADFQGALKAARFKILFLDDYGHAAPYSADLVLNQNVCAAEALYQAGEPRTRFLLGPRYCLLRREFAAWRDWKREISPVCRHLLVMLGGSDPENLTARVIEALALANLEAVETTVVVGGSNPHFPMIEGLALRSKQPITLRRDVANIPELMAAADMAVSAAGSTCWELCLLGLPALLLDVAANQSAVAEELDRKGCAVHVGDQRVPTEKIADALERLLNSYQLRQSLSQASRQLVDGNGARRVVSILRGEGGMWLRRVRAEDSRLLWEWANDPDVRSASFSSDPIPWETHVAWFAGKLGRSGSLILIAEDEEGTPWGQIRFDARPGSDWEVDISVARARRGRGLATELIKRGVLALLKENHNARIYARVKAANTASVNAFERADFRRTNADQIRDHEAIHLIYGRS
jgi:UDP-2,4-diacetamido-2,4,6-trideoxy-beta-L-altropyranose hydrolase